MRGTLRVRERRCPSCAATARGADARWCGGCGAPLDPDGEAARPGRDAPRAGRDAARSHRGASGDPDRDVGPRSRRTDSRSRAGPSRRGRRGARPARALRALPLVAGLAALVALLVTAGSVADRTVTERRAEVRDVAVAAPSDEVVEQLASRPPPPVPDRTEPACVRGGTDDCLLWTVEVPRTVDGGHHLVVDNLVLTSQGPELVARELATGEERWRTDELGALTPYQGQVVDDLLVLTGEDRRAESIDAATSVAAGVELATGEVRWREGALSASIGAGGTSLVTTGEGFLRAHAPDGALRWESAERIERPSGGVAWAAGHVVLVAAGPGGAEVHRLSDGQPLGLVGHPVAFDEAATFVVLGPGEEDDPVDHALVDEDGLVWRSDTPAALACFSDVRMGPTAVEVTTCSGERIDLLREDGSAVDVHAEPDPSLGWSSASRVGAYVIRHREASESEQGRDVLVRDAVTRDEVAVLPADTWPVWGGEHQVGDEARVVVLAAPDRLIALPPTVRRWNGRSSGTSELRSLFAPATLSVQPR